MSNEDLPETENYDASRDILIFLDKESFSKKNLATLYGKLSKKFPTPHGLNIKVETEWKTIPTPDECASGSSHNPNIHKDDDKLSSSYFRHDKKEFFIYNLRENPQNFITVYKPFVFPFTFE